MGEVAEGDEVRPGLPILDIVDTTAMQVRALVNQADIGAIAPGQPAKIRLDAYPELLFDGRVELVAPLGVPSSLTPKVRDVRRARVDPGHEPAADAGPDAPRSRSSPPAATRRATRHVDAGNALSVALASLRRRARRPRRWRRSSWRVAAARPRRARSGAADPIVPTAEVTRGDFIEIVEIRGDVRPFRSIVVTAPYQAGELQILKLGAERHRREAGRRRRRVRRA